MLTTGVYTTVGEVYGGQQRTYETCWMDMNMVNNDYRNITEMKSGETQANTWIFTKEDTNIKEWNPRE
jgi:hypothetical protein